MASVNYTYDQAGGSSGNFSSFFRECLKKSATDEKFCMNYYPFGLQHNTSWTRPTDLKNNFLYNAGSELNEQTQNYETFYRQYDAALGRFTGVDIAATEYVSLTPYQYAANDPIAINDPLGDRLSVSQINWERNNLMPWERAENLYPGAVMFPHTYGYEDMEARYGGSRPWEAGGSYSDRNLEQALASLLSQVVELSRDTYYNNNSNTYHADINYGTLGEKLGREYSSLLWQAELDAFRAASHERNLDAGQSLLDYAGLVPVVGEVADLANAGIYALRGKYVYAGLSAAAAVPVLGYAASGAKQAKKAYTVYRALDAADAVKYVGITSRDLAIREAEHKAKAQFKGLVFDAIEHNLTKREARIIEQNLINQFGRITDRSGRQLGGQLYNLINSISPSKWSKYGVKGN